MDQDRVVYSGCAGCGLNFNYSFILVFFTCKKGKSLKLIKPFPLSSFPTLALTRSGNMGIFSDSVKCHPKKREHIMGWKKYARVCLRSKNLCTPDFVCFTDWYDFHGCPHTQFKNSCMATEPKKNCGVPLEKRSNEMAVTIQKKIKKQSIMIAFFWCPRSESNRYILTNGRFWVCCVYQFRHPGAPSNWAAILHLSG